MNKDGKESRASTTRMIASSMTPPTNPRTIPDRPPHVRANAPAVSVMRRAMRPPSNTRVSTSRPKESVPKRCSREGLCVRLFESILVGEYGTRSGEVTATMRWMARIVSPIIPDGDRRNRCQVSLNGLYSTTAGLSTIFAFAAIIANPAYFATVD